MTDLTYTVPDAVHGEIHRAVETLNLASFRGVTVCGDSVVVHIDGKPTDAESAAVASAVDGHKGSASLVAAKKAKTRDIDKRTDGCIDRGFEFKGQTVSLSTCCQITILALYQARDSVEYPITICNKSDSDTLTIDSAGEVVDLHASMFGAVMSARGSGVALKSQLIAATTVAEVEAVEDNR